MMNKKMNQPFELDQYWAVIFTSLTEQETMYIKLTPKDPLAVAYEGTFELEEFKWSLNLTFSDAYEIMTNCFYQKPDYTVFITNVSGNIQFSFQALVGGFLLITSQPLLLKPMSRSTDDKSSPLPQPKEDLTTRVNRLEQNYQDSMETLNAKIHELIQIVSRQASVTDVYLLKPGVTSANNPHQSRFSWMRKR